MNVVSNNTNTMNDVSESAQLLKTGDRPLLMLIDGNALVHRSWHAISVRQHLSVSRTGENTTAVYGFTNTFLKAIQNWNPSHCVITFDLPKPTFRHKKFSDYKAHRPSTPPELPHQFDRVRQIMQAFNVPVIEKEGYEADDLIGTLCEIAEKNSMETIILTGDTDTLQLVSPLVNVALYLGSRGQKVYNENGVAERYGGLTPQQQIDFKALQGDASDNIPGIPGVGAKTATKLLLEFGSIDNMYKRIDEITPPNLKKKLLSAESSLILNKELVTIVRTVPLVFDLEQSRFGLYNRQDVVAICRELEFFSISQNIPYPEHVGQALPNNDTPQQILENNPKVIDNAEALTKLVNNLTQLSRFTVGLSTTNKKPFEADLVGISIYAESAGNSYIPVGHKSGKQISLNDVLRSIKPLLENIAIQKIFHNANYNLTILANHNIHPHNIFFDTMIAAYLLGKKSVALDNLALEILNTELDPLTDIVGTGKKLLSMYNVPIESAANYLCQRIETTSRISKILEADIKKDSFDNLLNNVELPLVPILVSMQRYGVKLDSEKLHGMARDFNEQIQNLQETIYQSVGHVFKITSPQQLGTVLFEELGLTKTKRTKTGYSTDARVLEGIRNEHPVVNKILEYRQLYKLKSTYIDALPEMVNQFTGRLHTSYNQIGATTGRLSSRDPNLQNIPIRTELGKTIRGAFVAENIPKWLFISADYSQIELRVLAHLSKDLTLIEAFHAGVDIHTATASMMFNVHKNNVDDNMRRVAKILNFGVIYGLSAFGISQQTEFNPDQGKEFIDNYFASYPGILDYIEATKESAKEIGFVETILGRRRYIPEIHAANFNVRRGAERIAVNMPIQGTAADLMKIAMIKMYDRITDANMKTRMILQVHDELIFETPQEEISTLKTMINEEMPRAMKLLVPLKIDIKQGYTWGDF